MRRQAKDLIAEEIKAPVPRYSVAPQVPWDLKAGTEKRLDVSVRCDSAILGKAEIDRYFRETLGAQVDRVFGPGGLGLGYSTVCVYGTISREHLALLEAQPWLISIERSHVASPAKS